MFIKKNPIKGFANAVGIRKKSTISIRPNSPEDIKCLPTVLHTTAPMSELPPDWMVPVEEEEFAPPITDPEENKPDDVTPELTPLDESEDELESEVEEEPEVSIEAMKAKLREMEEENKYLKQASLDEELKRIAAEMKAKKAEKIAEEVARINNKKVCNTKGQLLYGARTGALSGFTSHIAAGFGVSSATMLTCSAAVAVGFTVAREIYLVFEGKDRTGECIGTIIGLTATGCLVIKLASGAIMTGLLTAAGIIFGQIVGGAVYRNWFVPNENMYVNEKGVAIEMTAYMKALNTEIVAETVTE